MTYWVQHFQTPWSIVLHDKMIIAQLVEKLPAFYGIPVPIFRIHRSPPLDPVLNQMNADHTLTSQPSICPQISEVDRLLQVSRLMVISHLNACYISCGTFRNFVVFYIALISLLRKVVFETLDPHCKTCPLVRFVIPRVANTYFITSHLLILSVLTSRSSTTS
jgi:hypothetical protein